MHTHAARPLVLAIESAFYTVTLTDADDATHPEAILRHIPLFDGHPRPVQRFSIPLLHELIASGDAVPVGESMSRGGIIAGDAARRVSKVPACVRRQPIAAKVKAQPNTARAWGDPQQLVAAA